MVSCGPRADEAISGKPQLSKMQERVAASGSLVWQTLFAVGEAKAC
jgi:hypothetical protein